MQRAVADPGTHQYPSNRGRPEFREAVAAFYARRFGVTLDPETEVMPAIGAKECIFNLNLAFLDPEDVALASDPGYPVYTGGPLLAGAAAGADAARARARLRARPRRDLGAGRGRARQADVPQLPEQPDRRRGAGRAVRADRRVRARHDILVVHDNAYSETTYDGYVAPSFLATPGAKEVGVEVFSLSKGYNMTGWRCAAIVGNADAIAHVLAAEVERRLGPVRGGAAGGRRPRCRPAVDAEVAEMNAVYQRRRDLVCDALRAAGVDVTPPKGTIYVWAPVPAGYESAAAYCEHVLEEAGVVISPGRRLRRLAARASSASRSRRRTSGSPRRSSGSDSSAERAHAAASRAAVARRRRG